MSILDTFVFLLKADEKDAVQGIKSTGEAFDNLKDKGGKDSKEVGDDFEDLGDKIKHESNKIKGALDQAFHGLKEKSAGNFGLASSITALAAAAGGAIIAGVSFNAVLERQESILQRVNDAANFNIDVSQYDALGKVFQQNGLDLDGFRDSVFDLNEALGEAAADAESGKAKSFKAFGVSIKDAQGNIKGADVALLELAGSMEKMSKQQAIFQIKQLGITDNATINLLLKGRKVMEEQIALQKQKGVLDKEDAQNALAYKAAMQELDATVGSLMDALASMLLPVLTDVAQAFLKFVNFVREHKGFVVGAFGAIAGIGVAKLIPMLKDLTAVMKLLKIETLLALWPFALIAAAVIAVGLLVDDLWNYFSGGESVIGDLVKQFPMLGDVIEGLKTIILSIGEAFTNPKQAFEDFQNFCKKVWDNMIADIEKFGGMLVDSTVKAFNEMLTEGKQIFTELWDFVVNLFKNLGTEISNAASNALDSAKAAANEYLPSFMQMEVKAKDKVENSPGGPDMMVPGDDPRLAIDNDANPMVNNAVPALAASNTMGNVAVAPNISSANSRVSNNTQTIQVGKVDVHTQATDAQGVANGFSDGLKNAYANTAQSYDDGRSH